MKYLCYLCCLICGPLTAQIDEVRQWQEKWANSQKYTLELLADIPEDSLSYRPRPELMTMGEQFQHMASNMYFLTSRYLGYQPAGLDYEAANRQLKDKVLTKLELIKALEASYAFVSAAMDPMQVNDLNEVVEQFFAGPKTKRQIAWLLQDHLTHHRGQVIVYARLLGIKPPRYRGW